MAYIGTENFGLNVKRNFIDGVNSYNKFGSNNDIDSFSTPEDLWGGRGVYTGFDATAGEAIEVVSNSFQDAGTLVSSGTATGGSSTTLVDTGATFVTAGVTVGDCIINDTQVIHGIVSAVTSETVLTVRVFVDGGSVENTYSFAASDAYRVASNGGTGAFVVKLTKMLETDYAAYISEYIIPNGTTPVDTVGTDYIRNSRALVIAAGGNDGVKGTLEGRQTTTTANVFWNITEGHNQTLVACDTCPAGKTIYISDIIVTMGRANGGEGAAEIDFDIREIGQVFNSVISKYITQAQGFTTDDDYIHAVPQYADYRFRCDLVTDRNTLISAFVDGYIVDNEQT